MTNQTVPQLGLYLLTNLCSDVYFEMQIVQEAAFSRESANLFQRRINKVVPTFLKKGSTNGNDSFEEFTETTEYRGTAIRFHTAKVTPSVQISNGELAIH